MADAQGGQQSGGQDRKEPDAKRKVLEAALRRLNKCVVGRWQAMRSLLP
ncbi:hypothetical protein SBI_08999 [Streptomyces bingchenggensis BCW-1]|uniref:Uncharacterized protein n=1 Tax=Streptomyces bingchenggensis (strain BCW-1) TaxID=749414 RepID=D7C077_STRBB|nr:hypothetical protein SBI_08999 [Streptomyces bingchenggensis BCW-1]